MSITPCRFQGQVYPSISEAARQTGYHRRTIERAIEAGTDDQVGSRPEMRRERTCGVPVLWGTPSIPWQVYPSIAKAARETRCSEDAVIKGCKRLNRHTFGGSKDLVKVGIRSTQPPSDAPAEVSAASAAGS